MQSKKLVATLMTSVLLFWCNPVTQASVPLRTNKKNINGFNCVYSETTANNITINNGGYYLRGLDTLSKLNDGQIAINGSFFKPDSGLNLGLYIKQGEIITSPILNRVGFSVKNGKPSISIPEFKGTLTIESNSYNVAYLNQPLFAPSSVTVFTDRYNIPLPRINTYFKYYLVYKGKVVSKHDYLRNVPPAHTVIVSSRLSNAVGKGIKLTYHLSDDFEHAQYAIQGSSYIVHNGQVFVNGKETSTPSSMVNSKRPRTAIGYTKAGKVIMIITTSSCNLYELGKIMKSLGCVEALNLDGGSSTQLSNKSRNYGCRRLIANAIVAH